MRIPGYHFAYIYCDEVWPDMFNDLFHGSDTYYEAGLPARGSNLCLVHHAEPPPGSAKHSAFRGATMDICTPSLDAGAAFWGDWVYHIRNFPGYDLNRVLEGRIPDGKGKFRGLLMRAELEIAIPAAVPAAKILNIGKVLHGPRGIRIDWPTYG